ncbi:type IV toxin-antitoxin system AbiEi family antitoxin domain-containing protein [Ohessyouella blattaphilus]|uniref:Uncharacterized protein n=1 Tax=Ohessyouella blattaphilus TaxID=2949333 RepID=A0ABT1EKI4_9FIRM|nr:hypothetical protein [Ohessyouella blattaphilus]MCP1111036.1 hypothetical protein [Ohessyouella blattaphilus]MCR8564430.1 hypothetical protein [Ohessyouella blattaphilus]MDL2250451.1 hypothetical protein [Lachnospiraceae bacterium OttesenSCG-928-J05]
MIKTTAMILDELKDFSSPADKLARLVKRKEYIPIVRGLYETERTTPGYLLAESIYGPSYLSFEFALSYHGLIPEAVYTYTSATFKKRKRKTYSTPFGTYTYRDIPESVYPYGVQIVKENNYSYKIASPEKALCDQLYKTSPLSNYKDMQAHLFENLRIDKQDLETLNQEDIRDLSKKYGSTNVKRLYELIKRL